MNTKQATEIIDLAVSKGAEIVASVSGGKDGQAMVKYLVNQDYRVSTLVHADLGRVEWPQSLLQCEQIGKEHSIPLSVVTRSDGLDMLDYWERRMNKLKGTGKPFWSSASNRYCTSDLKRGPINMFFTGCGRLLISAEGIRADESSARSKKSPLEIRWSKTSTFYKGMTPLEAVKNFRPKNRLTLTWYPIFDYTLEDVWGTYGMSSGHLVKAREVYKSTGKIPKWWPFHSAYVLGNDRVSCMLCVLGCQSDLKNGAKHNPWLLLEMIRLEEEGNATFKNNWSLKELEK